MWIEQKVNVHLAKTERRLVSRDKIRTNITCTLNEFPSNR